MKKYLFTALLILFSQFLTINTSLADELSERYSIDEMVRSAIWVNPDIKHLETTATEYRLSGARTPSGLWKLTLFYNGLVSSFALPVNQTKFWDQAQQLVGDWIKQYPESPSAHLAQAHLLLERASSYRGDASPEQMTPQDWKLFEQYTQQARQYLEANKTLASVDPHWYEIMERVAIQQNWKPAQFEQLLNEGLARHPEFYQLYFLAVDYYVPKWRGSTKLVEKFAINSVNSTQSKEGYGMYARIYWYASQTQFGNALFQDSLVDWSIMKKGIDDVLAKYPDQWNINNFAKFACLSGDYDKTLELMKRIQPSPLIDAWDDLRFFEYCKKITA